MKVYPKAFKRILITGSRNWPAPLSFIVNNALIAEMDPDVATHLVVQGGAEGADFWAARWVTNLRLLRIEAIENPEVYEGQFIPHVINEEVAANWHRFGRAAGPIRNQVMVDRGADVCLAFPMRNSRGTMHCMKAADLAGIPVKVYSPNAAHGWMSYQDWKSYPLENHPQFDGVS